MSELQGYMGPFTTRENARIREKLTLALVQTRTEQPMSKIVSDSRHLFYWVTSGTQFQGSPDELKPR